MTGGTIDKADLLKAIRKSDSTLAEYKTRKEREESKAEVDARLQQTARPRAPAFVPDDAVPPQQVALVQMFRGFKAGRRSQPGMSPRRRRRTIRASPSLTLATSWERATP